MGFAERAVVNATRHIRILGPSGPDVSAGLFPRLRSSDREYHRLLSELQRLRGTTYLGDRAITSGDLDSNGRHQSPADAASWHVLHVEADGAVTGCARYRAYPDLRSFAELDARHAALDADCYWSDALRRAICYEQSESVRIRKHFFEVSGWAIAKHARFSEAALVVALAMYALGRCLGGGRGIATATTRNHSSRILRRIGGRPLSLGGEPLPPYFDPRFGCVMELISFDTTAPNPRYAAHIQQFIDQLPSLQVVVGDRCQDQLEGAQKVARAA